MEFVRSTAATAVCSACFNPFKPGRARYDFDTDFSRHNGTQLVLIPVELENLSAPGSGELWRCPSYLVPCTHVAGPSSTRTKVAVYLHGMAANVASKVPMFGDVANRAGAFDIIQVEYAGYGAASPVARNCVPMHSSSSTKRDVPFPPSPQSLRVVARAVLNFLIRKADVREQDIVLVGRSMGSGLALELAAHDFRDVGGVFLVSPYTRIPDVIHSVTEQRLCRMATMLHLPAVVRTVFELLCKLGRVEFFESATNVTRLGKTPLFIVHGGADYFVHFDFAHRLNALAQKHGVETCTLVIDACADHSTVSYEQELAQFLERQQQQSVGVTATGSKGGSESSPRALSFPFEVAATFKLKGALEDALAADINLVSKYRSTRLKVRNLSVFCFAAASAVTIYLTGQSIAVWCGA
eukprot:Hpha_TRINITY_DN15241_c2_g17::TRINITY_DN15241_c2_g17_i1::g.66313::m.66313/K06889/K06889; uncharacterized protein